MSRTPARRPAGRPAGGLLATMVGVALLLSGCVGVPDAGPISSTGTVSSDVLADGVPAIDPEPPALGAGPGEIVRGFLDAMQASPVSTTVAKEYLTPDAQASWRPEAGTIVYLDRSEPVGTTSVEVRLTDADRYDAGGAWRGRLDPAAATLRFRLVSVDGEWRITDPPNALVVVRSWFDPRFSPADLYFFDSSGRTFVPEPIVAPVGESRASTLVRALLRGPAPGLSGVEQTFIPAGLELALSVPVDADGLARVTLRGDVPPLSEQQSTLMLAQLAWTMRQDPRVLAVRVAINGVEVRPSGGADRVEVGTVSSFDASGSDASGVLYGLRDGRLVAGPADSLDLLDGPFSQPGRRLRSVAVDLDGATAAAVSGDGRVLLGGPTRSGTLTPVSVLAEGADLLRPAWTADDRIWAVDRAGGRAVVLTQAAGPGTRMRAVRVPGVTGADVRRLLVSRDGSRVVALVRDGDRSVIVVDRVVTDADDRVMRVFSSGQRPRVADGSARILDVGWYSDRALAVLSRVGRGLTSADTVGVAGSPTGAGGLSAPVGDARSLIGSPDPEQTVFAVVGDMLIDLGRSGTGTRVPRDGVLALGYAG